MGSTRSLAPAHSEKRASSGLVPREWLAAHLCDPGVRVVEVDVSAAAYDDWDIDGAVFWNIYRDLKDSDYRTIDTAGLEALLGRSGIPDETTVVFYGYAPAFGLWLLELFGHRDVRILDCDRSTWRREGRPWIKNPSKAATSRCQLGEGSLRLRSTV
jgi:thiosulfate/3-mercaptopyruvate sulfurtransferase